MMNQRCKEVKNLTASHCWSVAGLGFKCKPFDPRACAPGRSLRAVSKAGRPPGSSEKGPGKDEEVICGILDSMRQGMNSTQGGSEQ